jgi:hypothetical protein
MTTYVRHPGPRLIYKSKSWSGKRSEDTAQLLLPPKSDQLALSWPAVNPTTTAAPTRSLKIVNNTHELMCVYLNHSGHGENKRKERADAFMQKKSHDASIVFSLAFFQRAYIAIVFILIRHRL